MSGEIVEIAETGEYYVIPEAAIQFLPEEWQAELEQAAEDGRAVLKSHRSHRGLAVFDRVAPAASAGDMTELATRLRANAGNIDRLT